MPESSSPAVVRAAPVSGGSFIARPGTSPGRTRPAAAPDEQTRRYPR